MAAEPPDYTSRNRAYWDSAAPEWRELGRRAWAAEPSWGIWAVPDAQFDLLADVGGKETLEVGCGTAYISAWIAKRDGRPVGLDNSWQQLSTAAMLQREFELTFPLIHGMGERLPFRPESFDMVISEYGSAIWSDPYVWIPEAARVLRPNGELIVLVNSVLFVLAVPEQIGQPVGTELLRPQFGMHRFEWADSDSVEFHISHGAMISLLRATGFELLQLIELEAPQGAADEHFDVPRHWATRWPSEEIWRARKI